MPDGKWKTVNWLRPVWPVDEDMLLVVNGTRVIGRHVIVDDDDSPHMRWEMSCGCPIDDEPTHWMELPLVPQEVRR